MRFWAAAQVYDGFTIPLDRTVPVVLICPGAFDVDDEGLAGCSEHPDVRRFFEKIARYEGGDPTTLQARVSRPLERKRATDRYMLRKLLGLQPEPPAGDLPRKGPKTDQIEVFQISYSNVENCFDDLSTLHRNIEYASAEARRFVDLIFGPIIGRYGQNPEEAVSCLRQITLFGISYGSAFLVQVENALRERLAAAGLSVEGISSFMTEIYCVAISNVANVAAADGPRFSAVYFEGSNDEVAKEFNPFKLAPTVECIRMAPRRLLIAAKVPQRVEQWLEMIPGLPIEELNENRSGHYAPFYTLRTRPCGLLPALIERALRSAVHRRQLPLGSVADFFLPRPSKDSDFREWIDTAENDLVSQWIRASECLVG